MEVFSEKIIIININNLKKTLNYDALILILYCYDFKLF